MADDITLNTGSGGSVLAADDVSSVYYQKVKLDGGGDGATTPIVAGGGVEASALRVTIASDSTGVISIDDGGNTITVDGTVTANLSAVDNAVLDQIEVNTSYGDQAGGGVEASALRVTIANDSTGLISVDDNGATLSIDDGGGAITVDGTVTANLGTANVTNAGTFAVQVDAALPAGTNAIGKLAANSGVDIGDVDVTSLPALATGTNTIGRVSMAPATTGGMSSFLDVDLDETAVAVATGASQLYGYYIYNNASATRYVHFYNVAQGSVTVGTTTPDLTLGIPAGTNGAAANVEWTNGIPFGTALTMAATTTVSGADAPGANDIVINVLYAE